MLDPVAYRAAETNAKRAIADWRLCNINDPYIFQNQGFPVRTESFLDLAQILDTMQEGRFDYYMAEIGGLTEEDLDIFLRACVDYVDFYRRCFQRDRVIVPLSTMISHFVLYRKLVGYDPGFKRLLEIGPGCGYLSFFLRGHRPLSDYSQIESTESFYLLQSHINSHVFESGFSEHGLPELASVETGAYLPKLAWHNQFHYEEQKIIKVPSRTVCNHFPWWRIADVAERSYDLVTCNANLNEFSREALFQYLSLMRDVLKDDGAIVAQCLGGGKPSYEAVFADMRSAGFVPVALLQGDNAPGRIFVVSNAVFVGEKHPLYAEYKDAVPTFPRADRKLGFVNRMYYLNEQSAGRGNQYSADDLLHLLLERIEERRDQPPVELSVDREPTIRRVRRGYEVPENTLTSTHVRDVNRLRRVAQISAAAVHARAPLGHDRPRFEEVRLASEVASLRNELDAIRSTRSWRATAPMRSMTQFVRNRLPTLIGALRWLRRAVSR